MSIMQKYSNQLRTNLLLGQRFLASRAVLEKITSSADLSPDDVVLEVGAGKGVLTEALSEKAGSVLAIEKDVRFVKLLREKFKDSKNVDVIEGDILTLAKKTKSPLHNKLQGKYKIVANLPYYITSHFLRVFLAPKYFKPPTSMTLLIQKEVAERITLKNKKMNMLALSVWAYGAPKFISTVKPSAFKNPPKVDSAIIAITNISDHFFTNSINSNENPPLGSSASKWGEIDADEFFALAKKGFSQKRKQLRNSLKEEIKILARENPDLASWFSKKRPEDLSLEDWKDFYSKIVQG